MAAIADGQGVVTVAKATGLRRQTVYRIKEDPAAACASLNV
jgi:DNA invertase Pin-like site-specific DNA recombinase